MFAPLLSVALLAAAGGPQEADLGWLSGYWCTESAKAVRTCERWSAAADGSMAGTSETVTPDGASGERMTIHKVAGKWTFTAMPDGDPPTDFALVGSGPSELVFVNIEHDYPQRIRYWRDGAQLKAEIAMADGSDPVRWVYSATQR